MIAHLRDHRWDSRLERVMFVRRRYGDVRNGEIAQ